MARQPLVTFQNPYDLRKAIFTGDSYDACKVLVQHDPGLKICIDFYGDILLCAMENSNLDWVCFCLESHSNPARHTYHSTVTVFLAAASDSTFIEISELLLTWGARVKRSSALIIASHNRNEALVKLLFKKCCGLQ